MSTVVKRIVKKPRRRLMAAGTQTVYVHFEDRDQAMQKAQRDGFAESFSELVSKLLRVYTGRMYRLGSGRQVLVLQDGAPEEKSVA